MVLVKCLLDFPEQFFAAAAFAMDPPDGAHGVNDDSRLMLYALYQQTVEGPNKTPKPWGWNRFDLLKWNAWTELYNMSPNDAMLMYVATLEESNPNWWALLTNYGQAEKVKEVSLRATMEALEVFGGPEAVKGVLVEQKLIELPKPDSGDPVGQTSQSTPSSAPEAAREKLQKLAQNLAAESAIKDVPQNTTDAHVDNTENEQFSASFLALLNEKSNAAVNQQSKLLQIADNSTILDYSSASRAEEPGKSEPVLNTRKHSDPVAQALHELESQGQLVAELVRKLDEKNQQEQLTPYLLEQAMKQIDLQNEKLEQLEKMSKDKKDNKLDEKTGPSVLASVVTEVQKQGVQVFELLQSFSKEEKSDRSIMAVKKEEIIDKTMACNLIDLAIKEIERQSALIKSMQTPVVDVEAKRAPPESAGPLFEGLTLKPDIWQELPTKDVSKLPLPRQKHSATILGRRMYVIGGSYGGRSLNDIQVLDLTSGEWFRLQMLHGTFPAICCHRVVGWRGKLLVVGGFIREDSEPEMNVLEVDVQEQSVRTLDTLGTAPCVRGNHTAVVVQDHLFVFGGEMNQIGGGELEDLHVLNLETKEWSEPEGTGEGPCARFGHASCVLNDDIYIFGGVGAAENGGKGQRMLDDTYQFNTRRMEWARAPTTGAPPSGAQAAGVCAFGTESAFVVAGGVGEKGVSQDLHMLHVTVGQTLMWKKVDNCSLLRGGEGVVLCCCQEGVNSETFKNLEGIDWTTYLIAYGGYDGRYNKAAAVVQVGSVLEDAGKAGGKFKTPAQLVQASNDVQYDLATLGKNTQNKLKDQPKDAKELLENMQSSPELQEYMKVIDTDMLGEVGVTLARQAAEACRDAVREAAVLAAKEGARVAAKETRGPGQAAAVAVSSCVDAAAAMAQKQMLHTASYYELRCNAAKAELDELKDENIILARVQAKERQEQEEVKLELQQLKVRMELDVKNIHEQHQQEIQSITERLTKELNQAKADHAAEIGRIEEEHTTITKSAIAKNNMQTSEITILQMENQKLQRALKGMEELEQRVATLMSAGEKLPTPPTGTGLLDRMTNLIPSSGSKAASKEETVAVPEASEKSRVPVNEESESEVKPSSSNLDADTSKTSDEEPSRVTAD